ncbi:MAG: hypothetical protein WB816_19115 [Methylocystis sp.]
MKSSKPKLSPILVAALGGTLCLAASSAPTMAESWSSFTMKPMMAASFDAAANHIVGFFVDAKGACKLTLMIGDARESGETPASRLLLVVEPGRSARFDAADGETLQFACKSGALAMTATKLKSVAAAPVEE